MDSNAAARSLCISDQAAVSYDCLLIYLGVWV